jgi:hypothetical protein
MRLNRLVFLVGSVLAFAAGCGGAAAERPLTISLGLTHDQTKAALEQHQFCLETSSSQVAHTQQKQTYPRCKRAASEHGDAWVIARYDGDKLVELRRFERYGEDNQAVQRWNDLVGERMKVSAPSETALQKIKDRGQIEAGTRSVKAFENKDGTVVGVYLLTPSPPDNANVLEKISYVQ